MVVLVALTVTVACAVVVPPGFVREQIAVVLACPGVVGRLNGRVREAVRAGIAFRLGTIIGGGDEVAGTEDHPAEPSGPGGGDTCQPLRHRRKRRLAQYRYRVAQEHEDRLSGRPNLEAL